MGSTAGGKRQASPPCSKGSAVLGLTMEGTLKPLAGRGSGGRPVCGALQPYRRPDCVCAQTFMLVQLLGVCCLSAVHGSARGIRHSMAAPEHCYQPGRGVCLAADCMCVPLRLPLPAAGLLEVQRSARSMRSNCWQTLALAAAGAAERSLMYRQPWKLCSAAASLAAPSIRRHACDCDAAQLPGFEMGSRLPPELRAALLS